MFRFARLVRFVALIGLVLGLAEVPALAQRYDRARSLVQKVENDLQHTRRQGTRNNKEQERIGNARKHLSDFDKNLTRNKFDKDKLDEAIDDVKNVVKNNTLEPRDRDVLTEDLDNLRRLRQDRGL